MIAGMNHYRQSILDAARQIIQNEEQVGPSEGKSTDRIITSRCRCWLKESNCVQSRCSARYGRGASPSKIRGIPRISASREVCVLEDPKS